MLTSNRPMVGRTFVLTLAVGITFGFMFAYIVLSTTTYHIGEMAMFPVRELDNDFRASDPHHHSHLDNLPELKGDVGTHGHDEEFHKDEDIVAKELAQRVRVLCWIMTSPNNHQKKARHVKATWGKRCNILLFMSSQNDTSLPSIALPVSEGRDNLWAKTKEAFKYVYTNYLDQVDWVLKADDDTYVIVENLRYLLSEHNSSDPIYFGCRFRPYTKQGYMSGGAGYVLSKEAVRRFVEEGLPDKKKCREDSGGAEDVEMGKCLERVNVLAMDSRDSFGRGRFFPFVPEHHLIPGHSDPNFWYWKYVYYPSPEGIDCCSDSAISFHYVSPNQMYVLDYLIYHLRPYGINHYVKPGVTRVTPSSPAPLRDNR
ncbi:glycoprotein-N-acetylgalactosamine 3-beta-galactosyltransferase 1-like [Macrosteles quadrilineatus]|uniref:glycoprotein-N-acetylgalactosamine 3-beta-galactosyltransferase 1-like n=1 Tax=Macrosteles quadrilineatus TaxID=74068 RepID=UPI0023E0902E|nr:glycoprotein-N-acetylgalactosamine 3-beta-galactosyltransferase 1-like [Macrosteles quadrilineatus]XP_054286880.1 glycoprotein-N-acetylgalactosamine 3-beta-galactosyltransferase 1-like [Macrosteles quadrilineatus]